MQAEKCVLCEHKDYKMYVHDMYVFKNQTYHLLKCNNCGLISVHPIPDVNGLYEGEYFADDWDSGVSGKAYDAAEDPRYLKVYEIIKKIITPGSKVLEIGCAKGKFLKLLTDGGFDAFGIDISDDAVEESKRNSGCTKVTKEDFVQNNFDDNFFDAIYLGHVLEHFKNPSEVVSECKRALRPNGLLIIEVPCYVSSIFYRPLRRIFRVFRIKGSIAKLTKTGGNLKPYHLFEFTKQTIRMLLEVYDFKVESLKTTFKLPEKLKQNVFFRLASYLCYLPFKIFNIQTVDMIIIARKNEDG